MVVKEGYQQTEVGVIPSEWKVKKIREVCQLINGRGFKPFEWKTDGLPIIRIQNLNGSQDYNYYQGIYDKKLEVDNGQLLFAWSGSRGTSFGPHIWNGSKGLLNYHTWKIVINENEISKPFFTYALKKLTKFIEDNAHGASALVHTQKWEMEGFEFPSPSNQIEQTAIATALSDADSLLTGLEKLIAKKRNIKQGTMQELLQPKEGWEVKKLGEVATIVRGASPRPIEDTKWFDKQSPVGWVRISDVTKSKKVLLETTQKLSDLGVKNSRLVENGNLIMSICATVGRPILTTFDVCIHDGFVFFKNPQVDRQYLYYFLTFIEDNWAKSGQTGSQMNLNTTLINNTEIPFPKSPEEQTIIATILSDMDAELTVLEQKLEKYKKIKLGMMQELLTGKTRLV
ncbi:type I restriction enzyme, S subunit [Flavobacterium omnivorum]|uniref:Type I restriction enzyme, S subunit n=1 Tax=Flavobacterium omnivorum TaxID=178355 RepID=A0A1G7XDF3_9FLAO|nr:restriction endonuclease subunit S [Flavobacterium omnivorum]SDG82134.1 type I restriction enzyme, S subunit [Flavobacterium omnivorum]